MISTLRTRMRRVEVGLKPSLCVLTVISLLALAACSFKGSGGKPSPTPVYPPVAGTWDFTATATDGSLMALEAVLVWGTGPGDLSGTMTVNSFGGPGAITNSAMFEVSIVGASLASATGIAIDYLGNACGSDNGNRNLTGGIDLSGKVTLAYDVGGSSTITINGTFSSSATPPFSGSFTVSAPGCKSNGQTGRITGVIASSLTGTFSGTSASDPTDTIAITLTDTSSGTDFNSFSGSGSSKTGNFTLSGGLLGNFIEGSMSGPGSPSSNNLFFGYFDPRLGSKGSLLLTDFQSGTATSCPNGVPIENGSCLIAILAMQ